MNTFTTLETILTAHPVEYDRARAEHSVLAPYANPVDVRDAVRTASRLSYEDRAAVVLALIAEHQRDRARNARASGLWQALLLTAHEPMLRSVQKRVLWADRDDAEQCTLLAFLEVVESIDLARPPVVLALHLRHATERIAFNGDARSTDPETIPLAEAAGEVNDRDPRDAGDNLERDDRMRAMVRELVALFGDEATAREAFDLLLEARTGREPLVDYVARKHPGLSRARREAEYARLQRLRARALARLERSFGEERDRAHVRVA